MPARLPNQVGQTYGFLQITEEMPNHKALKRMVFAKCLNCDSQEKQYLLSSLRYGRTLSCGCIQKERTKQAKTKHGMSHTRQYNCWSSMIKRCTNPKRKDYQSYGAKGIKICEAWLTFNGFWADMQKGYSDNLELDRIDSTKNYEPANCRWVNESEQAFNTNKQSNNKSGISGVFWSSKEKKWVAKINKNNQRFNLGSFDAIELATQARKHAEIELYGYNKL